MPKNSKSLNVPSQFKKYFPEPVGNSEKFEDLPVQNSTTELKPNEAYCAICNELSTFPFVVHREWKAPTCKRCWQSNNLGPINFPVGKPLTKSQTLVPNKHKPKVQRKTWKELGINPDTVI